MRRAFATLLLAVCAFALGDKPAHAAAVPEADVRSVRVVVQAQLDAFAVDDAARAFSYAAPSLQGAFGNPERFLAMVRASYPVVYRPVSVAFLVPETLGDDVLQGVHFTDSSGTLWLAIYRLQRQPDKHWRIAGCALTPSRARTT